MDPTGTPVFGVSGTVRRGPVKYLPYQSTSSHTHGFHHTGSLSMIVSPGIETKPMKLPYTEILELLECVATYVAI